MSIITEKELLEFENLGSFCKLNNLEITFFPSGKYSIKLKGKKE